MTILNGAGVQKGGTATILVVGVARSGTSMVASTLNQLGVSLGDAANKPVFEDVTLASAIEKGDLNQARNIIEYNNARHNVWAFKRPEAFPHLPRVLDLFRSPRLVVTFRDAASIAKRNEISMHSDFLKLLRRSAERAVQLVDFVERLRAPTLIVSYEKAILNPVAFLDNLIEFCNLEVRDDQYKAALSTIQNGPELYLKSSRIWYEGRLEAVVDGVAYGWVRRQPRNRVCSVEIRSNGKLVGSGLANLPREDLMQGKIGACAFRIPVTGIEEGAELEATVAGTTFRLEKAQEYRG